MSDEEDISRDSRLWRTLASDRPASTTPVDLTHDLSDLSDEQRDLRRKALQGMLTMNQARQEAALRQKRPVMAIGERVTVVSGEFAGKSGVILDADFIHSRVQINIDDMQEAQWVRFKRIGSCL